MIFQQILNKDSGLSARAKLNSMLSALIQSDEGVNAVWVFLKSLEQAMQTLSSKEDNDVADLRGSLAGANDYTDKAVNKLYTYVDAMNGGVGGLIDSTSYDPSGLPTDKPCMLIALGSGTFTNLKDSNNTAITVSQSNSITVFFRAAHITYWNYKTEVLTAPPMDATPTDGNTTHVVSSDGVYDFVMAHGIDDVDVADTTGSDYLKDRITFTMRKNIGTESEPEYETIAAFTIPVATATKAGLMPAYVDGVFDVNRYVGSNTPYDSLSQVLNNAATLIPTAVRRGGMSIKFIQSSDNKYVQYRLMSDSFNTTPANWQGVDDEPTAGSDNLVKSGGVVKSLNDTEKKLHGKYFAEQYTGVRIGSGGVWENNPIYSIEIIVISPYAEIILDKTSGTLVYCILSSFDGVTAGESVSFATGYSSYVYQGDYKNVKITAPSDGHYLVVYKKFSNTNVTPGSIIINGTEILVSDGGLDAINDEITYVKNDVATVKSLLNIDNVTFYNSMRILSGNYDTSNSGYDMYLIGVTPGSQIHLGRIGTTQAGVAIRYCVVKDTFVSNGLPANFATGYSGVTNPPNDKDVNLTIPDDGKYLVLFSKFSNAACMPSVILIDGTRLEFDIKEQVNNINKFLTSEGFVNSYIGNILNGAWHVHDIYRFKIYPVKPKDIISMVADNIGITYTILKTFNGVVEGEEVDFATGYSNYVVTSNKVDVVVPSDGFYLMVFYLRSGNNFYVPSVKINGLESECYNGCRETLEVLSKEENTPSANTLFMTFPQKLDMNNLANRLKLNTIYHDNFNRADNASDIGNNICVDQSYESLEYYASGNSLPFNVGISSKQALNRTSAVVSWAIKAVDCGASEYVISCRRMISNYSCKVAFRIVDEKNFYYAKVTNKAVSFYKVVDGTHRLLNQSFSTTDIDIERFALSVNRDTVDLYIDGSYAISISCGNTRGNKAGLLFTNDENSYVKGWCIFTKDTYKDSGVDNVLDYGLLEPKLIGAFDNNGQTGGLESVITPTNISNQSLKFNIDYTKIVDVGGIDYHSYRSEVSLLRFNQRKKNYIYYKALSSYMMSFDLYIPDSFVSDTIQDGLWQMHDDLLNTTLPPMYLYIEQGKLKMWIASNDNPIWQREETTVRNYELGDVEYNKWINLTMFVREGYSIEQEPRTVLYKDGIKIIDTKVANCYIAKNFVKFGVYRPAWKLQDTPEHETPPTSVTERTVYFDNILFIS